MSNKATTQVLAEMQVTIEKLNREANKLTSSHAELVQISSAVNREIRGLRAALKEAANTISVKTGESPEYVLNDLLTRHRCQE